MCSNGIDLVEFLNYVLGFNRLTTSIRIPKSTLIEFLKKYLEEMRVKDEADLIFEDWTSLLRDTYFIGNSLIHYSIYSDNLTIDLVPTLQLMNKAEEVYSTNLREMVIKTIRNLRFDEFEYLMKEVFKEVPWVEKVNLTKVSRDDGIDFEGTFKDSSSGLSFDFLGQAKHWKTKVGSEAIRTFIGSIKLKEKSQTIGIYVSTSGYTDDAIKAIKKSPNRILCYDVEKLTDLMIEYDIGVEAFKIEGKVIDETFWKEISE